MLEGDGCGWSRDGQEAHLYSSSSPHSEYFECRAAPSPGPLPWSPSVSPSPLTSGAPIPPGVSALIPAVPSAGTACPSTHALTALWGCAAGGHPALSPRVRRRR